MEYRYPCRARGAAPGASPLEREIPLPGAGRAAQPAGRADGCRGRLLGVLCVESPQDMRFS